MPEKKKAEKPVPKKAVAKSKPTTKAKPTEKKHKAEAKPIAKKTEATPVAKEHKTGEKPAPKKAEEKKTGSEKTKNNKAEKEAKAKKKEEEKKAIKITKSKEVKKLSSLVQAKKRRMFRGRFGSRSIRKVSNKKWQKWRLPRGLDIYFKKEDGLVPGTGYRTPMKIRFVHPSGYKEKLVRNEKEIADLETVKASVAARISGTVGKKKKREMLKRADSLKIKVLNR